ncbi:hypothetical protein AC578_2823 [Pseudocercospora eumusae]|uniref:Uncharacterized protein n=1 Tax=Pseudocercospora eumusae TaxID=321146 RepID=A0A139H171_9PEZI|nr:hypothetical protein AC578_2823 [Pseudocercospora eumusae]
MHSISELENLTQLLTPKFEDKLHRHLAGINLACISRLSTQRLKENALPAIGLIESVTGPVFERHYKPLYLANFHGAEREHPDLIVNRLNEKHSQRRRHKFPYWIIGIRDKSGHAAAAAQFSIFLRGRHAIPYLQYIYVRPQSRRKDLSEVLHTMVLAIAQADAAKHGTDPAPQIPFTLCESAPAIHGSDAETKAAAAERLRIHAKSGSQALMPGLEIGESPLTLLWVLRANPASPLTIADENLGKSIIASYYQSLRDEGFPEENIALAESLVEGRLSLDHEFCLIPLHEVTKDMLVDIDQGSEADECLPAGSKDRPALV